MPTMSAVSKSYFTSSARASHICSSKHYGSR